MRKFKIITTTAALLLMVALMAIGVYAANSATFSVSGTIKFNCTDVYVKITYGLVDGASFGPYSSQPTDPVAWKDSSGAAVVFDDKNKLPDLQFTESSLTRTYFITVENMHGMDIFLNFGYSWVQTTGNSITASAKVYAGDVSSTSETTVSFNNSGIASVYQFAKNSKQTLKVTLTLDSTKTELIANGSFQMAMAAGLESGQVPTISF